MLDILYKRTTVGKIQTWQQEIEGNKYRTISGQLYGAKVTSAWTVCTGKNIGRANETSPELQAELEVQANYTKKLAQGKYSRNITEVDEETFFSPMLAKPLEYERITEWPVFLQPKLDGIRCIADKNGLWTRNGKPIVNCPHIYDELSHLFRADPRLRIDGELYNHDFKDDFNSLVSSIKKAKPTPATIKESRGVVQFHVYDLPSQESKFQWRKVAYESLLKDLKFTHVVETVVVNNEKELAFRHLKFMGQGYEGSIVRLNAVYENKRTFSLQKVKDFFSEEFILEDIFEGIGNWAGKAKSARFTHPNGKKFDAGIKGSMPYCEALLKNKADAIGKPTTVVYQQLTPDGVPRFGIMHSVRDYE